MITFLPELKDKFVAGANHACAADSVGVFSKTARVIELDVVPLLDVAAI